MTCVELAEHELFERLELEAESSRRRRKEEERLMAEAMGKVSRSKRRSMR
ncbi:MAG: hypothetical protein HGB01_06975 [Chlorobiaceae bacterium]|nr:hypothetical protein [Chlorobiaceae bacterium]